MGELYVQFGYDNISFFIKNIGDQEKVGGFYPKDMALFQLTSIVILKLKNTFIIFIKFLGTSLFISKLFECHPLKLLLWTPIGSLDLNS